MAQYMGGSPSPRNKAGGTFIAGQTLELRIRVKEARMVDDCEKISTGPNGEPLNDTIAGTGPGIADDALAPGEEVPEGPSDEQIERMAKKLHAPTAEKDTLPLEGE